MINRPKKITLAEMRASGVRGLLICCSDYRCSHSITVNADQWPDKTRLSDLREAVHLFGVRQKGCGGQADFDWEKEQARQTGFRGCRGH